jgi:hypothetical protein
MKRPDFGDVLKIGKCFSSVKGLLCITGVQIPAYIFRLYHEPPSGEHQQCSCKSVSIFQLKLGCYVTFRQQLGNISIPYFLEM